MSNVQKGTVRRQSPDRLRGIHRYACVLVGATLILIFAGGLVTSTGSALAVPDWPLSFGKFFPKMTGGVLYEHGHRMIAGTVAIMTLILAVWAWWRVQRKFVRRLALAAFVLVIIQAVLGGLTVLLRLPLWLAVSHAGTAQLFFCVTVALAMFTNPAWLTMPRVEPGLERPRLPVLAAITTVVIYLQILIGAVMRHMGVGLAIPDFPLNFGRVIPPLYSPDVQINFAHRVGALVVSIFVGWTVVAVLHSYRRERWLRRPALALLALLIIQVGLGGMIVFSHRAVIPTTVHVAVGALVLVTSLCLTLRAYRLIDGRLVEPSQQMPGVSSAPGIAQQRASA